MKVLAVDTSSIVATAAVMEDEKLIGEVIINHKKNHSEKLMPLIDQLFKGIGININEIDIFACASGPGSFTGLRIGAATVKGFAQVFEKPIVGVSTLEALAYNLSHLKGIICPILDAQRNQVYCGLYKWKKNEPLNIFEDCAMEVEELIDILKMRDEDIYLNGDGIDKFAQTIAESLKDRVIIVPATHRMPRSSSVAALAIIKAQQGKYVDYREFEPRYIRKSQAEQQLEERKNNQ